MKSLKTEQIVKPIKTPTRKIIAIGGGEMGRPGTRIETLSIDKEIVRLTGRIHPRLLFIPTASSDSKLYCEVVNKYFGRRLGCHVDTLLLLKERPTQRQIKSKIANADFVYVGGGNTMLMMKAWRKFGVDKALIEACEKGKVMSGLSAGSICWFRYGSSDSRKFTRPDADLIRVKGLDIIHTSHCPHYNTEKDRGPDLRKMMRKTPGVAIALDECCALEVVGDQYRLLSSKKGAGAYKVYWKQNEFFHEKIAKAVSFKPLSKLLSK